MTDARIVDGPSQIVIGVDLGAGHDITTIARMEDGHIVEVQTVDRAAFFAPERTRAQTFAMLAVGIAAAVRLGLGRRPWKLTGRAATRARWRRMGRR